MYESRPISLANESDRVDNGFVSTMAHAC